MALTCVASANAVPGKIDTHTYTIKDDDEIVDSIYMITTEKVKGDFAGRNGADKLCSETKINTYSHLPGKSTSAFISIDNSDYIAQMTSMYTIPDNYKILGPTDIIIADNWSDLLDGSIINSLISANVSTETGWWSGSNSDGSYDSSVDNCKGWTSTRRPKAKATAGSQDSDGTDWIKLNSPNCSASRHVLCVTW